MNDTNALPQSLWLWPAKSDPRWLLAAFLALYVVIGHLLLSFNRSLFEVAVALVVCSGLDMLFTWVLYRRLLFPLSGIISGLGLAILFTAPGAAWLMALASWLTISGKYLITWRGHHLFNPTNLALVIILVGTGGQAAVAPSYQWGGYWWVTALVFTLGLVLMSRCRKLPLVLSFWAVYTAGAFVRAFLTHLPAEITLWATVSGGAFLLFSFFMITDPKTSPASTKGMILFGAGIGLVDFFFQWGAAVFSLFYALFAVSAVRGLYYVVTDLRQARLASAAPPAITA